MTVGGEGFRYDLWPIVGGPSLDSRFAQVLDEIDMADRVELLTLEKSIALMYPSQGSALLSLQRILAYGQVGKTSSHTRARARL